MEYNSIKVKSWLYAGLICSFISPFLLSHFVIFKGTKESLHLSWTILWMIANFVSFLLLKKCAYNKPGTKLLKIYLILSPLMFVNIFFQLMGVDLSSYRIYFLGFYTDLGFYHESFNSYSVSYLNEGSWNSIDLVYTFFYILLTSSFYYLSIQLFRKNISVSHPQSKVDTSELTNVLDQAENLDSLKESYYNLITKWPQFESLISKKYKICKALLETTK